MKQIVTIVPGMFSRLVMLLTIALILYPCSRTSASDTLSPRRFSMVLSGGGSRGLAQIGVLKALDEAHLRPHLIVGTSMGAIIGALFSAGYTPDSILSIAKSIDWNNIFTNSAKRTRLFVSQKLEPVDYLFEIRLTDKLEPVPPNSISYGQAFFDLLCPLLTPAQYHAGADFDRLPIPLRIVTTDLLSGDRVVIRQGNLALAVRASCGIPLAFSPVKIDGKMLMDGGLASNIPVETAQEEGPSIILAVDVTSPLWKQSNLDNPVRLMDQVVGIGEKHQKESSKHKADVLVAPDLEGFLNTDFSHVDTIVARGYEKMRHSLDTLVRLMNFPPVDTGSCGKFPQIKWTETQPSLAGEADSVLRTRNDTVCSRSYQSYLTDIFTGLGYPFNTVSIFHQDSGSVVVKASQGMLTSFAVTGNHKTSPRLIRTATGLSPDSLLTKGSLQKAITSLYATNLFNNVNIDMDTSRTVHIMVDEKKYWRVRVGLRYDNFHLGEGYLQPAYENLFGRGICALAHLQYGLRREKYALDFQGNHLFASNFANYGKFQTYLSTERISKVMLQFDTNRITRKTDTTTWSTDSTLRKGGVLGLAGIQIGRTTMLSSGIHLEFYKVQSSNTNVFNDLWGLQFLPYMLLRLSMDSMDDFPFPESGNKNYLSIGAASTKLFAKKTFIKFDGSFGRYVTLARIHTFFPQMRFAWTSDSLPPVEQIYMGGILPEERYKELDIYNSVPFIGMPTRKLPGDIMAIAHLDYRLKVRKNIFLSTIMDWGYVWKLNDFSWETAGNDFIRFAPVGLGVGVAIETFVGPLRFTYGRLIHDAGRLNILSDNQLYLSFGHDF